MDIPHSASNKLGEKYMSAPLPPSMGQEDAKPIGANLVSKKSHGAQN